MCCDLWGRKESDTTERLNELNAESQPFIIERIES